MKKVLKRLKLNKKGFTFAECIVAIALFAIVGTLAFTMFNTSTRYMSKAKKEEAKRAQAQEMALVASFMHDADNYIIYPRSVLEVTYMVVGNKTVPSYTARLTFKTDYGDMPFAFSLEPTHAQPVNYINKLIKRYTVISDKGTKRTIFIYESSDYDYDISDATAIENNLISKETIKNLYNEKKTNP